MASMTVAKTMPERVTFDAVEKEYKKHSLYTFATIACIIVYFIFSTVQFNIIPSFDRWNGERGSLFMLDMYAHKDHVSMKWGKPEETTVKFEGGYRYDYFNPDHSFGGKISPPEWFSKDTNTGTSIVKFQNGGSVILANEKVSLINWPGLENDLVFKRYDDGKPYAVGYENRELELPEWIRVTDNKIEVRPTLWERVQLYRKKVEVHRYDYGWKFFFFDFNSPLRDYSIWKALSLTFSGDRLISEKSNFNLVYTEIKDNELWLHGVVWFALLETVIMAVLGTLIASIVSLPLAFLTARNVFGRAGLRFFLRRCFDFLRGIDMLVWSLIFLRAFGPGVFTGIFAIAFTDTGSLGKLMSEAIENADKKQNEGVASTGASKVQQHRFGIIPQILPVFISTSLYVLESNTRSAIIIGAMGAGGIGLQFLGALQTGTDFENVAYMAIVVLAVVIGMDMASSSIRSRLIGMDQIKLFAGVNK